MAATLYAVPASHPCAAVEKALQLKGIEYRRVDIPPVAHKPVQYALFGRGTVPGLRLDGRKIIGSREIMRALDDAVPEPPLLPADEKERKSVGLAEQWGDEVLQPIGAAGRSGWRCGARPSRWRPTARARALPIPDAVTRADRAAGRARRAEASTTATELNVRADLRALDQHLARVERWMDHDVVGGEQPNAADLQIGSGLALLLTIEDVERAFGERRACELARRWFPDYPGHVPAGALPAEWFRERTAAG